MSKRLHKPRQSRPRNRKFPVYAYLLIGGGLLLILGLIVGHKGE